MTNSIHIHRSFEGVLPQANLPHVKNCTKEILEKELQKREIASKYDPILEFQPEGAVRDVQTKKLNVLGQQEDNRWWQRLGEHGAYFSRNAANIKVVLPYIVAVSIILLCTLVGMAMSPYVDEENFCMLYLLGVVLVSCRYGLGASLFTVLLSVFSYGFFVVSPHYTLMRSETACLLTFVAMLVVALTMSGLTARIKQHARQLDARVKERTHELAVANEALRVDLLNRRAACCFGAVRFPVRAATTGAGTSSTATHRLTTTRRP